MDLGLAEKRCLVTGASRGLGAAIVRALVHESAQVAACARNEQALNAFVGSLGDRVTAIRADLSQMSECERVVEEAVRRLGGGLDVLVNCATARSASAGLIRDSEIDDLLHRIEGKVQPSITCARAAVPLMRSAGGGGRIIFVGGLAARMPVSFSDAPRPFSEMFRGSAAQGLGNAALANFAKHLSDEVADAGITVNTVHPGLMNSVGLERAIADLGPRQQLAAQQFVGRMIPAGRLIQIEEVAAVVTFLASEQAGAVTGQVIAVDGGQGRGVQY